MIFEYQAEREHLKALGTNFTPATNWYVGLSSTVPVRCAAALVGRGGGRPGPALRRRAGGRTRGGGPAAVDDS